MWLLLLMSVLTTNSTFFRVFFMVWHTAIHVKVRDTFSSNECDESNKTQNSQNDDDSNPEGFLK